MPDPIILAFLLFPLGFVAIGAHSASKKKSASEDYRLAGRKIGPLFLALSTVAANNSGFMFIELIGAAYAMGISGMSVIFGRFVGGPRRVY
jgi:Na+/proline symporter